MGQHPTPHTTPAAPAVVFTNVRIFDGTGQAPFAGEVRVDGQRIEAVAPAGQSVSRQGAIVIDGQAGVLMPGLTEAHAHLTWPTSVEKFVPGMHLPPEELALTAARNARILLDHGFTSAYSAGALSKRLEIVLREHIESGGLPGLNARNEVKILRGTAENRELRDALEGEFRISLPQLSMGMSDDYALAVEEGATIVRVGRALFGARPAPGDGAAGGPSPA